jgi:RecG-like helicase/REP element-mobilizing transposase RayT
MELATTLEDLSWVPRPRLLALRRLRIETVGDLLTHYPRRHEDRTEFGGFPRDETTGPICLCGEVTRTRLMRFGGRKIFEAVLEEEGAHALSQPLTCRWFNLHYVQKMIATGQRLVVFGKVKRKGARLVIDHPEFEVIENDEEISIHFRRITPIYPATEGVSQRVLRALIFRVLEQTANGTANVPLPGALSHGEHNDALRQIHFPESGRQLREVRDHLVLGEFFRMQMQVVWQHAQNTMRSGQRHSRGGELAERFLAALPFQLTAAQERVLKELRADLERGSPMNRLLQGDVGSGKTVIAIGAMLLAVESGTQAALMAPTQILAEQHYAVLCRWLEPLGVRVALRTGARQEDNVPLPLFANVGVPDSGDLVPNELATRSPGSARVSRAGFGVAPKRTFLEPAQTDCARYSQRRLPHFEKPWAIYAVTIGTKSRRCLSPEARTIVLNSLRHFHDQRYELFAACVMPDHVHFLIQPWPKGENDKEGNVVFWSLTELLHSVKSFSAHAFNNIEGKKGAVWEKERFDRYVRSNRDLVEKFEYIARNPWNAGVVEANQDYPWVWTQQDEIKRKESPFRRDAETSTRDACATRSTGSTSLGSKQPLAESAATEVSGKSAGREDQERNERMVVEDAPQIIVGTHALLYEGAPFSRLGLAVIDEQHKFGVSQRAKLTTREPAPDVLVMTATPIPRTLTMTIYGDLDVSTIDEMPRGRGEIHTRAMQGNEIGEAVNFLRAELSAGRQAYIVYPLIDESEKLQSKAAANEFERWQERLRPFRCELLHGRIAAPEKQAIMQRFRAGETQALISTTIIEVGVDVANATVMLIENAERFGLSQLHQLRGRIGRGQHASHCLLVTADKSPETLAKLRVLEKTTNGFEISEADWDWRGPGDLLGTAQSGLPEFKLGDLKRDAALMRKAREAAIKLLQDDPELQEPENQRFRSLIVERQEEIYSQVS